jgi:TrmH family RNA methyltransferase
MQTLSLAKIKQFAALSTKKYRYRQQQFLIEGEKMLSEALRANWLIEAIVLRADRSETAPDTGPWPTFVADAQAFARISSHSNPEGVLAVLPFPSDPPWIASPMAQLPTGPGFLLEDLQDPGNLGTIIRSADWFGFKQVICNKGCVDVLNPKVLRSTMGSFFRVHVAYADSFEALLSEQADRFWATDMQGQSLSAAPLQPDDWLLIGNEARGLSPTLGQLPGLRRLHIPGAGGAESLNAAMAAAICGWQLFQRGPQSPH